MHIYIYTYIHVYTYTYIHMYIYTYILIYRLALVVGCSIYGSSNGVSARALLATTSGVCLLAMPHPMFVGIPVEVLKEICDVAQVMHNSLKQGLCEGTNFQGTSSWN